jgi:hypothetical protein
LPPFEASSPSDWPSEEAEDVSSMVSRLVNGRLPAARRIKVGKIPAGADSSGWRRLWKVQGERQACHPHTICVNVAVADS